MPYSLFAIRSQRSRGACGAPRVVPRCDACAPLRATRAPCNLLNLAATGRFIRVREPVPGGVLGAAFSALPGLLPNFASLGLRASDPHGGGEGLRPRRTRLEDQAFASQLRRLIQTDELHARLPRRRVGRTDPNAPCDGDGGSVRQLWWCRISLCGIAPRRFVCNGFARRGCGIELASRPSPRT